MLFCNSCADRVEENGVTKRMLWFMLAFFNRMGEIEMMDADYGALDEGSFNRIW